MNQRKRQLASFIICLLTGSIILLPSVIFATDFTTELQTAVKGTAIEKSANIYSMIGLIIASVLGVLGVLLLIVIIYAGILWGIIAQGDPAQIKKAQAMLKNAIIGVILVLSSYAISSYIVTHLGRAAGTK
jgi:fucose 4-O-acetylase-like acetyltransferase